MGAHELCSAGKKNGSAVELRPVYSSDMGRCLQLQIKRNITAAGEGNGYSLILNSLFQVSANPHPIAN